MRAIIYPAKLSLLLVLAILLGAGTGTTITPEFVSTPTATYDTVPVSEISAEDELWKPRVPFLRSALIERLRESGAFSQVLTSEPPSPSPTSIVLAGRVDKVDKGNRALRFLIGFGAGRAKVGGTFNITDATGNELAKFRSEKTYGGGAGIGGLDMVDIEELMSKLGEATAESVVRWSRGESIKPPTSEESQ